ncbi:unnamed protein product [Brassicogethes aeneus]|uniref:Trehalose 6-phosphate phosphatase n=1 Tax=Brassicogethes aeneus TaxID=1431903 RepID=A0A9P0FNM2_BRAAE|nr:unnamed protein product [Brassicogethes aeneus]
MGNSVVVRPRLVRMTHIDSADIGRVLTKYMNNTKNLALLLDYDGTLTPIVNQPDMAVIPEETKAILERLSNVNTLFMAIISGRAVDNVKNLVGIDNIHYAGNHGYEIMAPDGSKYLHEIPTEYKKKMRDMVEELNAKASDNGAWVEDKIYSITYHFRAVPKVQQSQYLENAKKIMEPYGFHVSQAHYGLEAKPPIKWDKGEATLKILNENFSGDWKKSVKAIFIGDDTTDEDAMRVLKGHGLSFRIAADGDVDTCADYVLSNLDPVMVILRWFDKYYCGM